MVNKQIVFVLASIDAPHILKRISEFIEKGFMVKVFGFKHFRETSLNTPIDFEIEIVGSITQGNYWMRILTIIQGVRKIIDKCKNDNVIYYLPSLDVAMFHLLFCRKPYIYEESDLKHTYVASRFVQKTLEYISKKIILNSSVSAFTSAGFLNFHFGNNWPGNVCLVPNKLRKSIVDLPDIQRNPININNIRFSFVGKSQFQSVYYFAEQIVSNFPQHEMHFWGTVDDRDKDTIDRLKSFPNCFFHGKFSNPTDMPYIYSNTDILLAIFDLKPTNWLYAEPNKLYDAIYFRVPIIAPKGTFLEKRVAELGIGYSIDVKNESVVDFINTLNINSLNIRYENLNKIAKEEAIDDNRELYEIIDKVFK